MRIVCLLPIGLWSGGLLSGISAVAGPVAELDALRLLIGDSPAGGR